MPERDFRIHTRRRRQEPIAPAELHRGRAAAMDEVGELDRGPDKKTGHVAADEDHQAPSPRKQLRNALVVEVIDLLAQVEVLEQELIARACLERASVSGMRTLAVRSAMLPAGARRSRAPVAPAARRRWLCRGHGNPPGLLSRGHCGGSPRMWWYGVRSGDGSGRSHGQQACPFALPRKPAPTCHPSMQAHDGSASRTVTAKRWMRRPRGTHSAADPIFSHVVP